MSQSTEKWNPLNFAIYSGNLDLIRFIINKAVGETKRLIKIPGIFKSQEISRLFPFIISLKHDNQQMFKFFWEELDYIYSNEETFESVFRLLAKFEQSELVNVFLNSRPTKILYLSMSYAYRTEFLDHVL